MASRLVLAAFMLSACSKAREVQHHFMSDEEEVREGFSLFCPAVTKVIRDGSVQHGDQLLATAARGLEDTPELPAFGALMGRSSEIGARAAASEVRSKIDELGMTEACGDLIAALDAHAEFEEIDAMPADAEYRGRTFRFVTPYAVRPWKEGPYAKVWDEGGVAFTTVFRNSLTHPTFLAIVPLDEMPADCSAAAHDYARVHGLEVVDVHTERARTRPAPSLPDCQFNARASEPHREVSGVFVAFEFATLLLICDGDSRVQRELNEWNDDTREALRPLDSSFVEVPAEGLEVSFPRWVGAGS